VKVTLRDCQSNAPLRSFPSIVTHAQGGTTVEVPSTAGLAPGQRINGLGVWKHERDRTYRVHIVALINFDTPPSPPAPGLLAGGQTIRSTVELEDRDHFTAVGSVGFYDSNSQLYLTGCSSAVGERLEL